ncbi:MAG: type II toxin-antitoxin system RelE/ParE family toxin [Spartobacteria bacterium]
MSLPVIFRDEAEADLAEAAIWYERRSLGLGAEFVRSVDACLALVSRHSTLFPVVHREARMALPRRFPYLIIYRVFPDFVSIVAVIHGKRHPRRWKARLEGD